MEGFHGGWIGVQKAKTQFVPLPLEIRAGSRGLLAAKATGCSFPRTSARPNGDNWSSNRTGKYVGFFTSFHHVSASEVRQGLDYSKKGP